MCACVSPGACGRQDTCRRSRGRFFLQPPESWGQSSGYALSHLSGPIYLLETQIWTFNLGGGQERGCGEQRSVLVDLALRVLCVCLCCGVQGEWL